MSVNIVKVETKKQLNKFVEFGYNLYKGNPYYIPDLHGDVINTLRKDRNAAFEFCEADYFLAYRDNKVVGRIAVIINNRANEKWNTKAARFGWVDFIDDCEVVDALFSTAENWARERGMNEMQGPLGFTDFDPEGMLVEGFDRLGTMATIYNYPYYPEHMKRLGYVKDVDWIEFLMSVPEKNWDKAVRVSAIVQRKYNLKYVETKSRAELARKYGKAVFRLLNESYSELYGFVPLSEKQIDQFIKLYLPFVDLRLISLVVDQDDNLVAVGISIYSLSEALKKAKGRLFPFGWWHLLKALFIKPPKRLDFLLVAVKPEFQSKGVFAMLFSKLLGNFIDMKLVDVESNPELEDNKKMLSQWDDFDKEQHKRRRAFKKDL
ncbi:MAG: N-acetyltransferase [Bacteroidaceae bacterium]|nr:N-acetyltransferase [Bacteroidaceae bacterium]